MSKLPAIDPTIRKAIRLCAMLAGIFVAGILGYHIIEGWSLFDSLYMTVITIGTVGYGETHELTIPGRVFTIFLIFGGMSVVLYALSEMTAFIVEGEMTGALRKRKMMKKIEQLSGHYILCGAGRTGMYVVHELEKTQRPFVVVERNPEKAEQLIKDNFLVVEGDATQDSVLLDAGIERAAGLMTALPHDSDNLYVVISARALNKTMRIVSKIQDNDVRRKFLGSGADTGVSTHFIGGMRMASELIRPAAVTFLDKMLRSHGDLRVEDVPIGQGSKYDGTLIGDLTMVPESGALLMALQRGDQIDFNPPVDTRVVGGNALIVMGSPEQVAALKEKLA